MGILTLKTTGESSLSFVSWVDLCFPCGDRERHEIWECLSRATYEDGPESLSDSSRLQMNLNLGVSENRLNPIVPNGFADHYPVFKWLSLGILTQHFQTYPYFTSIKLNVGTKWLMIIIPTKWLSLGINPIFRQTHF